MNLAGCVRIGGGLLGAAESSPTPTVIVIINFRRIRVKSEFIVADSGGALGHKLQSRWRESHSAQAAIDPDDGETPDSLPFPSKKSYGVSRLCRKQDNLSETDHSESSQKNSSAVLVLEFGT